MDSCRAPLKRRVWIGSATIGAIVFCRPEQTWLVKPQIISPDYLISNRPPMARLFDGQWEPSRRNACRSRCAGQPAFFLYPSPQRQTIRKPFPDMSINIKTPEEIEQMRVAGRLASEVLDYITPFVTAGVTTGELDKFCHDYMVNSQGCIRRRSVRPSGYTPYPRSSAPRSTIRCAMAFGRKALKNGDIVNLDITVIKNGFTATPAACSTLATPRSRPVACARSPSECMWIGIAQVRPGAISETLARPSRSTPRPRVLGGT